MLLFASQLEGEIQEKTSSRNNDRPIFQQLADQKFTQASLQTDAAGT